jgi:hypothetical protein
LSNELFVQWADKLATKGAMTRCAAAAAAAAASIMPADLKPPCQITVSYPHSPVIMLLPKSVALQLMERVSHHEGIKPGFF